MPKFNPDDYFPVESYQEALEEFNCISGYLLFEFARHGRSTRDTIIRNFIARTHCIARAIFLLWKLQDYQDCWILHRCLLDRLFHLSDLAEKDEFDVFETWSFFEQYKAINRVRSDPEFKGAMGNELAALTSQQKKRGQALSKAPPKWQRPKAEEVAKRLDMSFLYRYGYDFASTHVHPMANDGEQDFYDITKLEPRPDFPDQISVLSNTLLVSTMIMQDSLNASTLEWRQLVFEFLDNVRKFLKNGTSDFKVSFIKLGCMIEKGMSLCQASRK